MKKIGMLVAGAAILLVSLQALAREGQMENDFSKPLKAKNVQVFEKKPVTEKEKQAIEELIIKGKPAPDGTKPIPTTTATATGVLGPLATGNKYAIVIGICDYPDSLVYGDICLSDGDALNMYTTLTTKYGYAPENVTLLRDMNATFSEISTAVASVVAKAEPNDEVVFFYSGHGVAGVAEDGDSETTDEAILVHDGVSGVEIWDGQLKAWFEGIRTSRVAFIFDTCRAGGMTDLKKDGRMIVMASTETGSAGVYSTGEKGEGLFSHYFVKAGMLDGLADGTNPLSRKDSRKFDGKVAIEEAFDYAKKLVSAVQLPTISDLFFNDWLL